MFFRWRDYRCEDSLYVSVDFAACRLLRRHVGRWRLLDREELGYWIGIWFFDCQQMIGVAIRFFIDALLPSLRLAILPKYSSSSASVIDTTCSDLMLLRSGLKTGLGSSPVICDVTSCQSCQSKRGTPSVGNGIVGCVHGKHIFVATMRVETRRTSGWSTGRTLDLATGSWNEMSRIAMTLLVARMISTAPR